MTRLALLSGLGHAMLVAASLLVYVLATRIGQQRRHPSAALAWVLGLVAFPYAALPLFLLFGTRKFTRPQRHLQAPDPAASMPAGAPPWATRLLAGMELAPARRNEHITFHDGGAPSLQALLALIDSAEQRLDLCTFVFGNDAVGRAVAAALVRCAQRGVATRVLIDAVGSLQTPPELLRQWAAAGVLVRRFMPLLHNPLRGRTNLRNHRKLAVADGVRLWSGGRNLADEYFIDRPGHPAWIDLSFAAQGMLAVQAQAQFKADWRAARGRPSRPTHRPAEPTEAEPTEAEPLVGLLAQWVPSGPDHADDTVHALLMSGAYQAQRRIWAATPYFVPDDALLDAWCLACRRGVQVRLLVPRRSNHRLADWARERALRQLVAAGAEVWLAPAMVHAKAVLLDDELALCGSLNLDARSLFLNYEAMAAFYGPHEVQWLAAWHERQVALAQPYRARHPSWARDIFEGVVRAVGFQL